MASAHPRRSLKGMTPAAAPSNAPTRPSVNTKMTLRKGATFHSPSTPPSEQSHPSLPVPVLRRSQTCLADDVVDAKERRMAALIGQIDRSLHLGSMSPKAK